MLPSELSSDACSLAPRVERLAVTAEIVLDASGNPRSTSFHRSRIRSDHRFDYDELDRFFAGKEAPPAEIAPTIELARAAAAALAERRKDGLEVDLDRARVRLRRGRPRRRRERDRADGGASAHRAADGAHERARRRALRAPGACRLSTGSTSSRIRSGSRCCREARGPRPANAAVAGVAEPERGGRSGRRREPARQRRGPAPRTWSRYLYVPCVAIHEAGLLLAPQPRPCRPREPGVRPFHVADSPLPRPDRPPGAALEPRRRGG